LSSGVSSCSNSGLQEDIDIGFRDPWETSDPVCVVRARECQV
jgi:hypothetical protein